MQSVIEKFKEFELDIISRSDNAELWNELDNHSKYFPVAYSGMNLDFLIECQSGNGVDIEDLSVIICWDKKPVALWPLFLVVNPDGKQLLTFLDNAILPPYFINEIRPSVEKQIVKKCISFINHHVKEMGLNEWSSIVLFNNVSGLSEWYLQSLSTFSKSSVFHELFVDLSMDLVEIKSRFRKSYKSLISTGEKLWALRIIDYADIETWNRFKELHFKVSGRKTRSDLSWDIHYDNIIKGKSFLIALSDQNGIMVGGGFFNYTNTEGFYAVGAYDRSLFDKPIGHIVQYHAIKYLQEKKVMWYKIGLRPFASDFPLPTSKELAIGEFKQGFATHVFPKYVLKHTFI
jgi:FemAB family protein